MPSSAWHCIEDLVPQQAPDLLGKKVAGRHLCLLRYDGRWYALANRCPHAGGPLAGGFVNAQGQVVCPWHRMAFDPQTGEAAQGGYVVATYPLKEQQGRLWVRLSRPWWRRWLDWLGLSSPPSA